MFNKHYICVVYKFGRKVYGNSREMRRVLVFTLLLLVALGSVFSADQPNSVSIIVASVVKEPAIVTPTISISFASAAVSYLSSTSDDSTLVEDVDLTKDGSFSFSLLTADEVNILGFSHKAALSIEIDADGFHLYEDPDPDARGSAYYAGLTVKKRNAVPISTIEPEINIPGFSGSDENVRVEHVGGKNNKIEVTFNPGKTRADLVLGTFKVDWKGSSKLESGIYKAEVMVSYSTL